MEGVPAPLGAVEIENMISWLPKLPAVFPEAVELVCQMPQVPSSDLHFCTNLEKEI